MRNIIGNADLRGTFWDGTAADYSALPAPATAYSGQVWFCQAGSGGFLTILGIYKYPKGPYSPNASNVWELVPINVKVAEDSTTLVNVTDWTEFAAYAFDISIGDRLIYNRIIYENLTGSIGTAPSGDAVNWQHANLYGQTLQLDAVISTPSHSPGLIHYDADSLVLAFDTGIADVTCQSGQEEYYLVYNDSGSIINNGKACFASGVDATNDVLTVALADNSNFQTSAQVLGLATHNIGINELGLVTTRGIVRDFDTTGISFGLTYLGTSGDMTSTKPLYPANRISMGAKLIDGVGDGSFQVAISSLPRKSASRSYTFASAGAAAGIHWRAGFYDWNATSAALTQASPNVTYGTANASRAAHIGIVPSAAGSVDTGQVGLQVTGTLDSETGVQVASQTAVITDDITTLTTDVMIECLEKFSGNVTIAFYTVSGAPTTYSLTFNYGFSKYEDMDNIDATVTGFNAVWDAGANDTTFNVSLKFHNPVGWTYAASGFLPGNGDIANRLTDQAIDSNISVGVDGAYKRTNLNQFITGTAKEGVIIEVVTGSTLSVRSMDLHISAVSEELF